MKMFTTKEAAGLLGLKQATVAIYIDRGLLSGEKKGRDWLIPATEIERYRSERLKRGRPKR